MGDPIKKYQSNSVNNEKDTENMAFWGVDGIISDYPDRFSILNNR
jgi:glycerophosphoryl diester phosphodiesterase